MSLTAAQQKAVAARGNVLVMAGAGTGKTSTLVARCIDCLSGNDPASLDELLVVTFTEAAAAEARERIRVALDAKLSETIDEHWARQLALFDAAHVGTLHAFCFKLIRQHFYQLGLDPQVTVLDQGQARLLAGETLTELLDEHYAGRAPESAAVQELIETYASGRDDAIRRLVLKIHDYGQTRPDPQDWLARQLATFNSVAPVKWTEWLCAGLANWRDLWRPELELLRADNAKAAECADLLGGLPSAGDREQAAKVIEGILAAKNGEWPKGKKTELQEPLKPLFKDAEFLATLAPPERRSPTRLDVEQTKTKRAGSETGAPSAPATDPVAEDWNWCRPPMLALLQLATQFTARFTERKRADGVVDFHDLEQLALQLLWDATPRRPSAIAQHWRAKLRFVFVDEYQDINAAQDQIITALSREGEEANRFLVGDVKQSIYRFRLAEPGIFRSYARDWHDPVGVTIPLAENFRSRAGILEFANAVFTPLMREEVGGVKYDADAQLIPGLKPDVLRVSCCVEEPADAPSTLDATRNPQLGPDVEILFRLTDRTAAREEADEALDDLQATEREARHVARRLGELKSSGRPIFDRETKQTRPVAWRDMAVLLRAPSGKTEGYAKQFERAGVPLLVERGGFFDALEIADLLNLLRLLDNPLQDVPLLAVLRSPLVGLSLEELATIRLAAKGHFWTALVRFAEVQSPEPAPDEVHASRITHHVSRFLSRFSRWRKLARHAALSKCLDAILAGTHYAEWLQGQERGAQRYANVQRLLALAEQFDQFQRQGLFRFLRFVEAQREAGAEPEAGTTGATDAVRLMSVHQSKGLEFPIVVVADLGKPFNFQDLHADIILDEEFGLCPKVCPPGRAARYPSAAHWLANQRQKRELLGEELRLLYVALTRAREKLLLTGSLSRTKWEAFGRAASLTPLGLLSARSAAEWLGGWHAVHGEAAKEHFTFRELDDAALVAEPKSNVALEKDFPLLDDETFARLQATLTREYPFADATRRAAKTSVTALRRAAAEEREAEELFIPSFRRRAEVIYDEQLTAAEIGNAHHKFLQHVLLPLTGSPTGLRLEAERLRRESVLSAGEIAALNFAALGRFWQSEVGGRIRARAAEVKRELPFTARFTPEELDGIVRAGDRHPTATGGEFVIVQGVADLVVRAREEIWLLDFKTDAATKAEAQAKQGFYAPQLQLYARALERIYGVPVTQAWLHFLACDETLSVPVASSVMGERG